jgi:hypothetical protein
MEKPIASHDAEEWAIDRALERATLDHQHRLPTSADFVGKTVARFDGDTSNIWRFWFTDGSAVAIQCETFGPYQIPGMELCDVCVEG